MDGEIAAESTHGPVSYTHLAGAGSRARKRRNRGRMIVGFHLHQDMHRFRVIAVLAIVGIREKSASGKPGHDRRIVVIGRQYMVGMMLVRVTDHRKQRFRLCRAVDDPVSVKNLVAAMLGIGLDVYKRQDPDRPVANLATQSG